MKRTILFFVFGLLFRTGLWAQSCTANAMQLVYDAQSKVASGNTVEAVRALERAADFCVNSCKVLTSVAETYIKMGNQNRAARYVQDAQALGCEISTARASNFANITSVTSNAVQPADDSNSYVRQKWALVVGIDRFQDSRVPSLQLSAKDARDFAEMLRDPKVGRFHPETVKLLLNEEATLRHIRAAIHSIALNARPDDIVVLYFSTHGSSKDMDVATEEGKTGYIVAYDTDTNDLYATALSMEELKRVVDARFNAGRVITFLDTCYSGDTIRHGSSKGLFLGIPDDSVARIAQGKGRVVITSSRGTEQSWECEQYSNSCFTHQLLQAMREKNGLITVGDLFKQIQLTVPEVVKREKHAQQNPVMQPDSGKINIVIGTPVE